MPTATALAESLVDVYRRSLVASGYVPDPARRVDLAEAFIDAITTSSPAFSWHLEAAPTPEALTERVGDLVAVGWTLLHRESPTRAVLIRPAGFDPQKSTRLLTVIDETCSAIESLLEFTDRHRVSYPDHDHDCYERWCIERDWARRVIVDGNRARGRAEDAPHG